MGERELTAHLSGRDSCRYQTAGFDRMSAGTDLLGGEAARAVHHHTARTQLPEAVAATATTAWKTP